MGMNDAERTPSPKRFCRTLGIRTAALNASAATPCVAPRYRAFNASRTRPRIRDSRMPEATKNAPARPRRATLGRAPRAASWFPAVSAGCNRLGPCRAEQRQRMRVRRLPHVDEEILTTACEHRDVVEHAFLPSA